jgi:hypothetical protein
MTPVLNPSTTTESSQTPLHVPGRQVRKGPLIDAVQVPGVGAGAGGGGGGALSWQEQFQVPPTPGPPAILATVTEPLGCFTNLKPDFALTVPPISSTPSILAGRRFTRGFPTLGAPVVGACSETQESIVKMEAMVIIITLIRLMVSLLFRTWLPDA